MKKQAVDKRLLVIGGGVVVVAALLFGSMYSENIKTKAFIPTGDPSSALGGEKKCATQKEKDAAEKAYEINKMDIKITLDFLRTNEAEIQTKEKEIADAQKENPIDNDKIYDLQVELDELEVTQNSLAMLLAKLTAAQARVREIRNLPLCRSTPSPTKAPTPTPTPNPPTQTSRPEGAQPR